MPIPIYFLLPVIFAASWSDWKYRKIPNSLLLSAFLAAISLNIITLGKTGLYMSLLGTLVGFILLIIPYILGGMGAGDVKLLMVIGSFGGLKLVIYAFFIGAIIGGLISVGIYINNFLLNGGKINALPYGIPLSLGTIISIVVIYWRL